MFFLMYLNKKESDSIFAAKDKDNSEKINRVNTEKVERQRSNRASANKKIDAVTDNKSKYFGSMARGGNRSSN